MTLASPLVRVQIGIGAYSGIPQDESQINLFFRPPGGEIPVDGGSGTVIIDALMDALESYINNIAPPATVAVGQALGSQTSRALGGIKVNLYAVPVERGFTGPPFSTRSFQNISPAPADHLPSEVAAVTSYHADLTGIPEKGPNNTRPAASRRGRFYVGPLGGIVGQDPETHRPFLSSTLRQALCESAAVYLFGMADAAGWRWHVLSRALWAGFEVSGVFCDDAFDTQRRRGEKAVARTVRPF